MLEYENLKTQPRKFLAQTSLTVAEFEDLLPGFEKAYLNKFPVKNSPYAVSRHCERFLRSNPRLCKEIASTGEPRLAMTCVR